MSTEARIEIGKATVTVESKGCVGCGTQWSRGWHVARTIGVIVNGRTFLITIHRCADCQRGTA